MATQSNAPYLLVGLGNPGASYALHRHNVGFMLVDCIAGNANFTKKFNGLLAKVDAVPSFMALKPQTYMNLSGRSVQAAAAFYKIPLNNIVVVHDELDIPFGQIKFKQGGGHGGHNGLKSIDAVLGKDYKRVRIGIGHPGHKDLVSDYVLHNFSQEEAAVLPRLLPDIAAVLPVLMQDGVAAAAQALHNQRAKKS